MRGLINVTYVSSKGRTHYSPFLGLGILGSGWHKQKCVEDSIEDPGAEVGFDGGSRIGDESDVMRVAARFLVRGPNDESSESLISGCDELIRDA